ncbi:dihydroxyacetone kinase-like protein, partial [Viridothelium virens]
MSTKHFFSSTDGVVKKALNSLVARNPNLQHDEDNRVVFSKTHDSSKVTLISGGGSGHEPAWSGYVGDGMLTAAVAGDVFASPSTKQIMSAIKNVPSKNGIILGITNYTGDMLHFGLAREKGLSMGYNIKVVSFTDDAALGRKKSELVGRRGLAGNILVIKLAGAASEKNWSFERCLQLGDLGNANLVTIGTSLDHCHIPGRAHHQSIPEDACVLGMGVHNEPGLRTITPMPPPEEIVKEMLLYLLDPKDTDRAFVKFDPSDDVAMLINNLGGLSNLELEALTNIVETQLKNDWNLAPKRIYVGTFETSLNGPGFSVTLGNLSSIARGLNMTSAEIFELLDAPTTAPAWPKNGYGNIEKRQELNVAKGEETETQSEGPILSNPQILHNALHSACTAALNAEPLITKYDIQMGDGDCGEAVAGLCNALLAKLSPSAPPSNQLFTPNSTLFASLDSIASSVEDVGGSLGAILAILLAAFANTLRRNLASPSSSSSSTTPDAAAVGRALGPALDNLKQYTGARVGDRTVMDALIPFCDEMGRSAELGAAVAAAEDGARDTAGMRPRFGRATYVGDRAEGGEMPPDPGAYAAAVFLRGLADGL